MGNKQFVCVRIQGRESLFLKEWATKLRFYRTNEKQTYLAVLLCSYAQDLFIQIIIINYINYVKVLD